MAGLINSEDIASVKARSSIEDVGSVTCSLTTSSMDDRALTDAMSSLLMSPAICLLRWS